MREKRIGPDEIICNPKEDNNKLYFLTKGDVALFIKHKVLERNEDTLKTIQILEPGEMFNTLNFFTGNASETGARSLNVVSLIYINKSDFLNCI